MPNRIAPASADAPGCAALRDIRAALAVAYPALDARAMSRIARRHGLDRLPEGLLIDAAGTSPGQIRAAVRAADAGKHPLFSPAGYLAMNPDLATARVPPWLHYQVFGRAEGRSPHPLIDVGFLAASLPETSLAEVVDRYVADRDAWRAEPGPYVDSQAFLLSGRWDPLEHPLRQILTRDWNGPWIHRRLMLVDLSSRDAVAARLAAVAGLVSSSPASRRVAELIVRARPTATTATSLRVDEELPDLIVVPGFLVATAETALWFDPEQARCLDGSIVATSDEFIGTAGAVRARTEQLIVLTGVTDRPVLRRLLEQLDRPSLIAPFDADQETSLRQLRRDLPQPKAEIAATGRQIAVATGSLRIERPEPPSAPSAWDGEDAASDMAILLPIDERRRSTRDPTVRRLLDHGAALCLVDAAGLNTWLPIIQSRRLVLATDRLARRAAAFVEPEHLWHLAPAVRS